MSFADAPFYDYVIMADHPLRPGAILHCEGAKIPARVRFPLLYDDSGAGLFYFVHQYNLSRQSRPYTMP
uniref:Uncharacterized protein n=1 Tax=Pristionchus pacificus TaxID=54126 RepID=A0A2A6CLE6_PRIPA|eukprot:PDM79022.1 hypothetical protein PRIPAC_31601 [Pristionchus pacificus]